MAAGIPKGLIFDIQRASLHDGPGIRTTVFLKGCPLKCAWCHNPEGISGKPEMLLKQDTCVLCGACSALCTHDGHWFSEGKHWFDYASCVACGECMTACAQGALTKVGREMEIDEVMSEVRSDRDFYENSGGGITLSGGEPLVQLQFSVALLRQCRNEQIHTCLETSGFAPGKNFLAILRWVDYLLFDYKMTAPILHQKYTGVENRQILQNLEMAYHFGVPVVLRCPVIPSINDKEEHFQAICKLVDRYPRLEGVELMPFHNMGRYKAQSLGQSIETDWQNVTLQQTDEWLAWFANKGYQKIRLG